MKAETAEQFGATLVDKRHCSAPATSISLHLVLGDRSRNVVAAQEFGWMQKHAVLINTSRGPLVNEADMIEAMRAGRSPPSASTSTTSSPAADASFAFSGERRPVAAPGLRDARGLPDLLHGNGREHSRLPRRESRCVCSTRTC